MRVRTVYDKIARRVVKNVKCSKCLAPIHRQRTFWQTMNPFNVHELTKLPKDRMQIERELRETCEAWQRKPELCATCSDGGDEEAAA